ncbi:MAG: M3 family oligoendopeptidase, partial [Chitinophagaceae bacterium]|nr:M3 family oligoendopeptidase [Chitinophagaceae bacterium]
MNYSADIQKLPRNFLPADFGIKDWDSLAPYFTDLEKRDINSVEALEQWLKDASELEAVISEDACWRQIKMTCDTESKELEEAFTFFMMQIQPQIQPWSDRLNKKLLANPFLKELDQEKYYT